MRKERKKTERGREVESGTRKSERAIDHKQIWSTKSFERLRDLRSTVGEESVGSERFEPKERLFLLLDEAELISCSR